jgi:hypothetical protein
MKKLLILILSLSLIGCATQKSVERYLKKHGGTVQVDSVFVTDTLQYITEKVETDTVFSSHTQDTVIIRKENLTIKTYYHNDSIYVWGQCDTDTVTIIKDRWVGNTLTLEEKYGWLKNNWLLILALVVFGLYIIRKK